MTSTDVHEMQRRMRQLDMENENIKRLHSVGVPRSSPNALAYSGTRDVLLNNGAKSPVRYPLPSRGSGTDLYQSALAATSSQSNGITPSSSQSDLVAAAAAASHKTRQMRSRPGSGALQAYATGIQPSQSWGKQLDQRQGEDAIDTIHIPGNLPYQVDDDTSSSIGLDMDDIVEMKKGYEHHEVANSNTLDKAHHKRANLAGLRQDDVHFRMDHETKPHSIAAPAHHMYPTSPPYNTIPISTTGQFNSAPIPATSSRQYHSKKNTTSSLPRSPLSDINTDSPPLPNPSKHRQRQEKAADGASKFVFPACGTKQDGDISLWVGTWNLGAADPFGDATGIINQEQSSQMVRNFVPHGYDIYILGVQEGVSENIYHAFLSYLNANTDKKTRYFRKELRNDKFLYPLKTSPTDAIFDAVRGRGDGAFMGTKFTGLAVFYSETVSPDMQLLRAGCHKFSIASGSKGGVAVALKLKYTTVVFVNCHLDARNDSYRREQIRILNTQLGRVMGHPSFDLTEQFHHVVWMGDLNYRIVNMESNEVLRLLTANKIDELHERGDGLLNDRQKGIFEGFIEPRKWPTFYPTYKKFPLRGPVDTTKPDWPEQVYRTLYKEPFYKGGQVKKRVPGWCDRILVYSTPIRNSYLAAEKVPSPFAPGKLIDNYKSINDGDGMDISDHSPVSCSFLLKFVRPPILQTKSGQVKRALVTPKDVFGEAYVDKRAGVRHQGPSYGLYSMGPVTTVLTIFNMVVMWNSHVHVPKKTRIVAPLLGEDDSGKQTEAIGERTSTVTNMTTLSLNVKLHHERGLQDLHMLVWVRHENLVGHCVVSLRRVAHLGMDSELDEARYKANLYNNSMPVELEGFPVKIIFSVRSNVFTNRGM
ncbi:hypothetical protein THRCLA_09497 [Thraustotheca clavata]|uniref:Inositol polyphosphate-related phosphatase domain-containing protein n=1 Tax=Thraustotheca clavata TaxID=74557 RepID=A0A1V9YWF7_9STRA|nr:hypothetical protein THRCLA_09497 [Thraustotheca clavata]